MSFFLASELCTDLANDIWHGPGWNPIINTSPHATSFGQTINLNSDIPCAVAKDLDVIIPPDDWGRVDDFIDNGILIVPDLKENSNRVIQSFL